MYPVFDLLVLTQIPGIGPNRLRTLVSHFGGPEGISSARAGEIASLEGFGMRLAGEVAAFFRSRSACEARLFAERQLARITMAGGEILSYWDDRYPGLLKRIYDPPALLFTRGPLVEEDACSIAVVGTRNPSSYGLRMAERFAAELSQNGLTVVSGLARGIDTAAHAASLASGGRTIAVLGSGLDAVYPPENRPLAERVCTSGAVVSEYAAGERPEAAHFPRRNRIISGLSLGTLVVESDLRGGGMITAGMALEEGREVFAVPGEVTSGRSRGCNALIREGRAKLVESVDDILVEIELRLSPGRVAGRPSPQPTGELSGSEIGVYEGLTAGPLSIGVLGEKTGLKSSRVLRELLRLEEQGLVRRVSGNVFARR